MEKRHIRGSGDVQEKIHAQHVTGSSTTPKSNHGTATSFKRGETWWRERETATGRRCNTSGV
jgi:hypothetical protein